MSARILRYRRARQVEPPPLSSLDRALGAAGKPKEFIDFGEGRKVQFIYKISDQLIRGIWEWIPTGLPAGVVEMQDLAVPYRPTAVKVMGQSSLIVAGIGAGGSTTIERWEFSEPSTRKIRQFPSGEYLYLITPGGVTSKSVLFSDHSGSEGPVNFLLKNHGMMDTLLVGFLSSRDVYSLDINSGAMSMLLSGAFFPTSLGLEGFRGLAEVDHPTKGYLYFLGTDSGRLLVMRDASRNGILSASGVVELSGEDYVELGYEGGVALNRSDEWPRVP
jgi:hypothetical protein